MGQLSEQASTAFFLRNKERIYKDIRDMRSELQQNIKFLQDNAGNFAPSTLPLVQEQISEWKRVIAALEGF